MSLGLWLLHYKKIELQGFSNAFQPFSLNIFLLPYLVPEFRCLRCVCLGLRVEHVFFQVLLFNITCSEIFHINLYQYLWICPQHVFLEGELLGQREWILVLILVLIASLLSRKVEPAYILNSKEWSSLVLAPVPTLCSVIKNKKKPHTNNNSSSNRNTTAVLSEKSCILFLFLNQVSHAYYRKKMLR